MGDQIIYLEKYIDSECAGGGVGCAYAPLPVVALTSQRPALPPPPCHIERPPPAAPAGTTSLPAELNRILNSIKDLDERSDGARVGGGGAAS